MMLSSKCEISKEFKNRIGPKDDFAHKFVKTADEQNLWHECRGVWEEDKLCGAYIQTIEGRLANFKLLHVFADSRGKGYGEDLVRMSHIEGRLYADYWKCTSELDAIKFYEKLGFKHHGLVDYCDAYLILGKFTENLMELDYNLDEYVNELINTKYRLRK